MSVVMSSAENDMSVYIAAALNLHQDSYVV